MSDQVKIRFFTRDKDESIHVLDNPLLAPVQLRRYGLSEIVNHLLESKNPDTHHKPIPFDFLIKGTILKTSIQEYLIANGLSSEVSLELEYTRAVLPPSFLSSFNNEDWVSSIDLLDQTTTVNNVTSAPKILSGSYDGIVRVYNLSGQVVNQLAGHSQPIKSVKFISPTRIVSAGNDRSLRLWKSVINNEQDDSEDEDQTNGKTIAILEGHKAPVVSLDVCKDRILSASSDNSVGFWSTNYKEMTTAQKIDIGTSTSSKKRAKLAIGDASVRRKSPLSFMEGHAQPVEGVIFDGNDSTVGYSCSQDHTVKTWDLVTSRCVDTRTTSYSLLSIAQLKKVQLIACGSSARHITLHDPRVNASSSAIVHNKLVGHTNFVVSLAASPDNEYLLSSASHDGTVKVWDIRANKSLYTLFRNGETKPSCKIFDVKWDKEIGLVSGGSDKKIQINKGTDIAK